MQPTCQLNSTTLTVYVRKTTLGLSVPSPMLFPQSSMWLPGTSCRISPPKHSTWAPGTWAISTCILLMRTDFTGKECDRCLTYSWNFLEWHYYQHASEYSQACLWRSVKDKNWPVNESGCLIQANLLLSWAFVNIKYWPLKIVRYLIEVTGIQQVTWPFLKWLVLMTVFCSKENNYSTVVYWKSMIFFIEKCTCSTFQMFICDTV